MTTATLVDGPRFSVRTWRETVSGDPRPAWFARIVPVQQEATPFTGPQDEARAVSTYPDTPRLTVAGAVESAIQKWERIWGAVVIVLLAIALSLPAQARALDEWTWQDTAWELGAIAATGLDWAQTRQLAWNNDHLMRDGRRYPFRAEGNPVLGRDPSMRRVDAYFISTTAALIILSPLLPRRWRRVLQLSTLELEFVVVGSNKQMGLSFRF